MEIKFLKCHGTGNDFVLIDEISHKYSFTEEQRIELAKELCRRDGIIGADGILFVQESAVCDAKMRIFNSDGSEPEMCGNGLRCVARYAAELLHKDSFRVETMKSSYAVRRMPDIYEGVKSVGVELESISFKLQDMPMVYAGKSELFMEPVAELDESLKFSAVSMTNPHIVAIVEDIDIEQLTRVGLKANNSREILPRGINVNFIKILGRGMIYVKTFERGVGLTKSCGTGMISSSITLCRYDASLLGEEIMVYNDGGMIKCTVHLGDGGDRVTMAGNATHEYRAELEFDFDKSRGALKGPKEFYNDEAQAYGNFLEYTRKIVDNSAK